MSHAIQTKPSYEEAIQSLSTLIPELLGVPGIPRRKFSLDEIRILSAALGNPHMKFPSVLVAGTNGKGSTSATLASIARASGLRVGLYTSPHLARVNERIRILDNAGAAGLDSETWDSGDIPDQTFADLYFRVLEGARRQVATGRLDTLPSFFEHLTALAFLYFAEERVDLAVLEVGMGGRLDATNLVDPILSVITDISLDHQEWLGSTIALIAGEKAGILRENGTLITLPQHPEANQAIGEAAVALNVRGVSASEYTPQFHADPTAPYPIQLLGEEILVASPLKGAHQHRNTALAIAAAVELAESHNFPITPTSIQQGIQTTHWPGRLETVTLYPESLAALKGRGFSRAAEAHEAAGALAPEGTEIILDVAHNPAGAWALRAALNASKPQGLGAPHLASEMWEADPDKSHLDSAEGRPQHAQCLIFACLRDKPLREMAQILFPIFDHVILAPIHSPRATDLADLLAAAESTGTPSTRANTVAEAIQLALALHPARIVISGSVYLVGEARTLLLSPKASIA
jgi:dihydrofolate synthase / folylpolyglutamate synthase